MAVDDDVTPVAPIPRAHGIGIDGGCNSTDRDPADTADSETNPRDEELFEKFLEYQRKRPSTESFPEDSYTLIALNFPAKGEGRGSEWWKTKAPVFFFGLMPFAFQIALLYVSLLSAVRAFEENDADLEFFARLYQPSTSVFVTQITILLAYASLPRSSLRDVMRAIRLFPSCSIESYRNDHRAVGIAVSCILRFFQGFIGIVTILAVIFFKSEDAITIILNFTALDYISELDEYAVTLCKSGMFGTKLKKKADAIADQALPEYMNARYERKWRRCVMLPTAIMFVVPAALLIISQANSELWTTKMMRVEFGEESKLGEFSGCFAIDGSVTYDKRHIYHHVNQRASSIGYCREYRQWILFESGAADPCEAKKNGAALALSSKTDSFEVSSSFSESWTSSNGVPLELFFWESETDLYCDVERGNGICDPVFNTFDHNFDEGDCCSATCKGPQCGRGALWSAFGNRNISGDGFRDCRNPDMVPLTIQLNGMTSSRDPKIVPTGLNWYHDTVSEASSEQSSYLHEPVLDVTERETAEQFTLKEIQKWRSETPKSTYFALYCNDKNVLTVYFDQRTENASEIVFVEDGATCTTVVQSINDQKAEEPIWVFNYTLFQNDITNWDDRIEISSKQSWQDNNAAFTIFPDCFFDKLKPHIDIQSIYTSSGPSTKALEWLLNDKPNISRCEDFDFIERYALANIHFSMNGTGSLITREEQCTLPAVKCSAGSVQSLDLRFVYATSNRVPSEISLLQNLEELYLGK